MYVYVDGHGDVGSCGDGGGDAGCGVDGTADFDGDDGVTVDVGGRRWWW